MGRRETNTHTHTLLEPVIIPANLRLPNEKLSQTRPILLSTFPELLQKNAKANKKNYTLYIRQESQKPSIGHKGRVPFQQTWNFI